MIIYTTVGISDLPRALKFYQPLFADMGLDLCGLDDFSASWGRKDDPNFSRFSIGYPFDGQLPSAGNGTMTAFRAATPAAVDSIHHTALANGGHDDGAPGWRAHYSAGLYAAYVRDPDGNKLAFHFFRTEADAV